MKAAIYRGKNSIRLEERLVPEPAAGEVLIKVDYAGICGTDLGTYKHGGLTPEGMTLGREFSGSIVSVGDGVEDLEPGQRMTVNPMKQFVGLFRDGAFAEFVLVPTSAPNDSVFTIPDAISAIDGPLVEPLAVALRGINRCELTSGTRAVVQRLGTIGLWALMILHDRGVRNVVAHVN